MATRAEGSSVYCLMAKSLPSGLSANLTLDRAMLTEQCSLERAA